VDLAPEAIGHLTPRPLKPHEFLAAVAQRLAASWRQGCNGVKWSGSYYAVMFAISNLDWTSRA